MGIRGFTSFVDSNSDLLQNFKLHDTKVVIDGNNLYHFLYSYLHVKHQYGGDYDIYYRKVRDIFQMFLSCNIKPFVVFDGSYEADGKKLKTILTRAKNRIHLAGHISHGGRGQILPILAEEVFKNVLQDLEISFVVCDFEADAELVKLANQWKCPVMSNDSDFFVFNLPGGFILFDYIDFRLSTSSQVTSGNAEYYLSVQLFHVDNFIHMFPGFDKDLLPIIAILLGNDFIESALFENFLSSLRLIGSKSLPQRHRRIKSIFHWLQECRSCDDAVGKILQKTSNDDLQNQIQKCLSFYTEFDNSFSLSDYFSGDMKALCDNTGSVKMYSGARPAGWFVAAHRSGSLHGFLLNTAVCRRVILLTQVENMRAESAYNSSARIRQVMYGIILKDDPGPESQQEKPTQATHVLEYTRDEFKNLKKSFVSPVYSLPVYGILPGLVEVDDASQDNLEKLLLEVMDVPRSFVQLFSPPIQLLICVVLYWVKHSQPKVFKHHYHALLVCIILLQAKIRIKEVKKSIGNDCSCPQHTSMTGLTPQICVQCACIEAEEQELSNALQKLDKYHGKFMPINNTNPVESSITHGTSQFQACLFDAIHLNKLLREPIPCPQPHSFISGVFLYNFSKELRSRSKPELYIYEALGVKSPLTALFKRMNSELQHHLVADDFQVVETKKKGKKKKGKKSSTKGTSGQGQDSDASDELPEMVQAACELDNRFSCLLLDDE